MHSNHRKMRIPGVKGLKRVMQGVNEGTRPDNNVESCLSQTYKQGTDFQLLKLNSQDNFIHQISVRLDPTIPWSNLDKKVFTSRQVEEIEFDMPNRLEELIPPFMDFEGKWVVTEGELEGLEVGVHDLWTQALWHCGSVLNYVLATRFKDVEGDVLLEVPVRGEFLIEDDLHLILMDLFYSKNNPIQGYIQYRRVTIRFGSKSDFKDNGGKARFSYIQMAGVERDYHQPERVHENLHTHQQQLDDQEITFEGR